MGGPSTEILIFHINCRCSDTSRIDSLDGHNHVQLAIIVAARLPFPIEGCLLARLDPRAQVKIPNLFVTTVVALGDGRRCTADQIIGINHGIEISLVGRCKGLLKANSRIGHDARTSLQLTNGRSSCVLYNKRIIVGSQSPLAQADTDTRANKQQPHISGLGFYLIRSQATLNLLMAA